MDNIVQSRIEVTDDNGKLIGTITPIEGTFKEKPMLQLIWSGAGRPVVLNFGVGKWKMISKAASVINAFVAKHEASLGA